MSNTQPKRVRGYQQSRVWYCLRCGSDISGWREHFQRFTEDGPERCMTCGLHFNSPRGIDHKLQPLLAEAR